MAEHYTHNTESIVKWCNRCSGQRVHKVSHGRVQYCEDCVAKQQAASLLAGQQKKAKEEQAAKQSSLF